MPPLQQKRKVFGNLQTPICWFSCNNCYHIMGYLLNPERNRIGQMLGQRRIMGQGDSARYFVTIESMKNAGILDVFPIFRTARLGQKIRRSPQSPPKRCCLRERKRKPAKRPSVRRCPPMAASLSRFCPFPFWKKCAMIPSESEYAKEKLCLPYLKFWPGS